MSEPRKVVILGATGSIGTSALKIISHYPEQFQLVGISAHASGESLAQIARKFSVPHAAISDDESFKLARQSQWFPDGTTLAGGAAALEELAALPEADIILIALVGIAGLEPMLSAIRSCKQIILANKEVLVMAGEWVMQSASAAGARVLPADSEHNAIFQCLDGQSTKMEDVEKILLTASGGPFRDRSSSRMADVTPDEALNHPNWDMGPKVTLDSATMANKGLELIEARWLFDVPIEKLDVVVHPQSIVHSMVQFRDGSILAQMNPPDMVFPLQHCLFYPDRFPAVETTIDFRIPFSLDFSPPDLERFPCLKLARQSLADGRSAPCIYNAANEVAGKAFLEGRIGFTNIAWVIDKTLESSSIDELLSLDAVHEADRNARRVAAGLVKGILK